MRNKKYLKCMPKSVVFKFSVCGALSSCGTLTFVSVLSYHDVETLVKGIFRVVGTLRLVSKGSHIFRGQVMTYRLMKSMFGGRLIVSIPVKFIFNSKFCSVMHIF